MIYLDYTATTPVDDDILDTYIKTTHNFFANSSSLHKLGEESNYMYLKAKDELLKSLGLKGFDVVYTSNATEANNLSIGGIVKKYKTGKIITTKIEHSSVYEIMKSLENDYDVVYLDVDSNGIINLEQLKREIDNNTILVSIMWVNNIVGVIEPIKEVIEIVKNYKKVKLHVDAVQGLCKIKPDFNLNDIDMFTFSTHKLYGPKGIGGFFYKSEINFAKILYGSDVQQGIKPGTFDLPLIVSTTKVFKKYVPLIEEHYNDVTQKFNYLYDELNKINKIHINTPRTSSHYILNISIPNVNGETIVHYLEKYEIYVSTGSACASKIKKPEKTIMAMTSSEILATSTIRISLSHKTTINEIDTLINVLKKFIGE